MSNVPKEVLYTPEHEYVRRTTEEGVVVVGITDFAQDQLGDVVFVELPKVGSRFEVVEINGALDADPALVNTDPYGNGWMIRLRIADESELAALLDAEAYEKQIS